MRPGPFPVSMAARFALGQPMTLALTDGEVSVTRTGPVVEAAKSRPSTEADARRQLDKLGGTPFALEEGSRLQVMVDEGIFLPVSALNALRREAVERLIQARTEAFASAGRPSRSDACPSPAPAAGFPHRTGYVGRDLFGPDAGRRDFRRREPRFCALRPARSRRRRSRATCRACRAARGCACLRR